MAKVENGLEFSRDDVRELSNNSGRNERDKDRKDNSDDGYDVGGGVTVGGGTKEEKYIPENHRDHDKEESSTTRNYEEKERNKEITGEADLTITGSSSLPSTTNSKEKPKDTLVDPNKVMWELNVGKTTTYNGKTYTSDCDIIQKYHANGEMTFHSDCNLTVTSETTTIPSSSATTPSITNPAYIKVTRDKLDLNTSITSNATCDLETVCVPSINVPDSISVLGSNTTNKVDVTKLIQDVSNISNKIESIPEFNLTAPELDFNHTRYHSEFISPEVAEYIEQLNISIPDKSPDYSDLSQFLTAPFPEHKYAEFNIEDDPSMSEALKKLEDLLDTNIDINEPVKELNNDALTERIVDGRGTFDWLASAMLNQLDMARKSELIDKADLANVYTQSMLGVLQTASQFVLEKDRTYWANMLVRSQMAQANVQAMLAKAQLITLPIELKLKYAELHAQLQQLKLLGYQAEYEKVRVKQTEAQTDQILVQTDGLKVANHLSQVQLQDAMIKLNMSTNQVHNLELQNEELQVKIQDQKLKLDISKEQVVQTKEQTKQLVAQTEQIVEGTKHTNAQWQKTLKEIKLVEANVLETSAKIKLMAQQTEKESNQVGLVKGQVAEAYTRIALLGEQIKAAKAQYSDTIDGKPVQGIIGTQNALHRKQSLSYDRDSLYKVLQLQAQGWQVKKTSDMGIKSPAAFTAASLDGMLQEFLGTYYSDPNTVVPSLGSNLPFNTNGLGAKEVVGRVNLTSMKPVADYTDYVSDAEMDLETSTSVGNTPIKN